jgi:putative FmdB family regulatory protein
LPKYLYYCEECKNDFFVKHSIKEEYKTCKECGTTNKLIRQPTSIFLKKSSNQQGKTGQVVNDYIKEIREDLKQEKSRLKNLEYEK